jgi:glucose-6-phosphate isomerase
LASKSLSTINTAEYQATLQSILNNKLPTRTITLDRIDEYNFGQLMMLTTFETVIIARLMDLNPFDQPGVEQIKVEARKILASA